MFVGPSAQTETALTQMEQLAGLAQPFYEEAAGGVTAGLEGLRKTAAGSFLGGATFKNAAGEDVNYRDASNKCGNPSSYPTVYRRGYAWNTKHLLSRW
jgi:hypothetical protein